MELNSSYYLSFWPVPDTDTRERPCAMRYFREEKRESSSLTLREENS